MIRGTRSSKKVAAIALFAVGAAFAVTALADIASAQVTLPSVNLGFKQTTNPSEVVNTVKIILMMMPGKL